LEPVLGDHAYADRGEAVLGQGTNDFELASHVSGWWGGAWSPDGSHLAFIRWNTVRIKGSNVLEGGLMTIAATGGQETKISGKEERVASLFGWVD
jgi:hypothetical protein